MLNAIFSGKKRGTGLQNQQTALELAEGAEDVLTASVFERLAYLPNELSTSIFSALLGRPFGPLRSIEYWPSWHLSSGPRVEPDLLLEDTQCRVLVEAKRHDHVRQQSAKQLANELLAGWHSKQLGEHCILLTLGGLDDTSEGGRQRLLGELLLLLPPASSTRFTLVCRSWQQLYQVLEAHIKPDDAPNCLRLLEDIASCYAWHGLRTHPMRWLKDLKPIAITHHPDVLSAWKSQ
ncbi:F-box domain-containing protein [Pseudomonas sp.]|uniref:F-box domain-containing protein n=1 Tax=Pseudomonas sp. TaxID=306 RepID=UPI003D0C773C